MIVGELPNLPVEDFGSLEDSSLPVLSLDWTAAGPHRVGAHTHPRAQVIYQRKGVYRVVTSLGSWVVPPGQAIWIPPLIYHEAFTNYSASALMFFVDRSVTATLARDCVVFSVAPLLAELFARAVEYGNDYAGRGNAERLMRVLLDELDDLQPAPLHLPLAADKRLRRVMDALVENPGDGRSLEAIAASCGASGRTLARLFRSETGMSFVEWRRQLRLLEAIDRLGSGQAVTNVALDLGYRSLSAFSAMFRRALSSSPTDYKGSRP